MKVFLSFAVMFSLLSCSGQKTASIYLAHCDSLFYMEGERFDAKKIKRGKMTDSVFINDLFGHISPNTHNILFKPYTDLCIEDGMAPLIINWKTFLANKGFSDEPLLTDSMEDKYFGDISLRKFVTDKLGNDPSLDLPSLPKPPPPPPIIITRDGKPIPGGNEDAIYVKAKGVVTFLLSATDAIYYYEGIFNGTILKTDHRSVGKLIKRYSDRIPANDLVFIIKADKGASFKNTIDLMDEMTINKISPGHYAETEITDKEIESINNFKEK